MNHYYLVETEMYNNKEKQKENFFIKIDMNDFSNKILDLKVILIAEIQKIMTIYFNKYYSFNILDYHGGTIETLLGDGRN